jgi:hypothetical protein
MKKIIIPIIIMAVTIALIAFFLLSYFYIIIYPDIPFELSINLLRSLILIPIIGMISVLILRPEKRTKIQFLIVFAILVVGGYATNHLITGEAYEIPGMDKVRMTDNIVGCAETNQGMTTRAPGDEGAVQDPAIEVNGNSVTYSRAINHMCCRKVTFNTEPAGYTLNMYEYWIGEGCRCMCFSEVGFTLEDMPSGTYTINVFEKGEEPGGAYAFMEEKLLISEQVTIS